MAKKKTPTAEILKSRADHFMPRDWNYTRNTKIEQIRYEKGLDTHNDLSHRIKSALFWAFGRTPDWLIDIQGKGHTLRERFGMARYSLKRDPNLPDGILNDGGIIVFWEEDGEYINLVQPSVGSLLADFLIEEPNHPHAKKILAEMGRILIFEEKTCAEDNKDLQ